MKYRRENRGSTGGLNSYKSFNYAIEPHSIDRTKYKERGNCI